MNLISKLWKEEHGFVVSAELVLVASIAILAMIVGLSEASVNVNNEMEDVASAVGRVNQQYFVNGQLGHMAGIDGSINIDYVDFCDRATDIQPIKPVSEYATLNQNAR